MQKKLIALAIAGLASTAAFAQSNVTIYGRMDYGYESRSGTSGGTNNVSSRQEFASGLGSASRLGFKGLEDLGNGLKAVFEMEYGIGIDQTTNTNSGVGATTATWTNRHSYIGLTNNWGTVVGGRLDGVRYGISTGYDAFGGGSMGNWTQMVIHYDRADNAIAYISPTFGGGFSVLYAHSTNTAGGEGGVTVSTAFSNGGGTAKNIRAVTGGNQGDDVLNTIMVAYANGPLKGTLDYETTTQKDYGSSKLQVVTAAISYDFGVVKLSGFADRLWIEKCGNLATAFDGATLAQCNAGTAVGLNGGGDGYDKTDYYISAKIPVGKFDIKTTYGRIHNKLQSNADGRKFGLGVDYNLSKRTTFYADYGHINNDQNATYAINPGPNAAGAGVGVTGFAVGMGHNF
jgi:predicted porin